MSGTPSESSCCYFCGESEPASLERHHLVPDRYGGSDQAENLVVLCGSCHNKVERLYTDEVLAEIAETLSSADTTDSIDSSRAVEPSQSIDRMIPPQSDHAQIERLEYFPHIDSRARRFNGDTSVVSIGESGKLDSNKNESAIPQSSGGSDHSIKYDKQPDYAMRNEVEYPDSYRLHCSYCKNVYTQHEHSELARHLRVRHGIENPYEFGDTSFFDRENEGQFMSSITGEDNGF